MLENMKTESAKTDPEKFSPSAQILATALALQMENEAMMEQTRHDMKDSKHDKEKWVKLERELME